MGTVARIEQLDEINPEDLTGNELFMTSVGLGGTGRYVTKKMSMNQLVDYVNSNDSGDNDETGFGGYEMIDTSDSNNYIWNHEVGSANGNNSTRLEKKVSRDCLVWLSYN